MVFSKSWYLSLEKKLRHFMNSDETKYARYTLYVTLIGFVLRLVGALHLDVLADDMVYASQSAGILDAKLISTHSNPPLFFYLTDIAYQVFGYSTLASRFWPLIAGTMLIPLVYLIANNLLNNRRVSFFAALFVAASSFLIRMTFTEQSLVVLFFIFSGIYFGMLFTDRPSYKLLLISSIFFGFALLTKYNAPFFIISFAVYALFHQRSRGGHKFIKSNYVFLFAAILLLFALPFLSFNYILYSQKGIVDVYFSRLVHLESTQQLYGGLGGQENSFIDNLFNLNNYGNYKLPALTDPLLVLFALYGLFGLYKTNKRVFNFVLIFLIIPFVLQSAGAPLQKHFAFMYLLLAIPAGFGLSKALDHLKHKNSRIVVFVIFALVALFCLGISSGTPSHYFSKGPNAKLKSFINNEVSDQSLLVFDSRIYTARTMWLATDKAYLTFDQAAQVFGQISSQNISSSSMIKVYFIECVVDDCGWGWVHSDQNLNASSEGFVRTISQGSDVAARIESLRFYGNELTSSEKQEYYRVYSVDLRMPPQLLEQIKGAQNFYFAPYLYKDMGNYIFNYKTIYPMANLLDNVSYLIILLSIILVIAAVLFLILIFLISS